MTSMYFATHIANFLACPHIATLERQYEEGLIKKERFPDPGAELLRKLGLEHELKYLNELQGRGLKIVEISTDVAWTQAAAATREAVVQGVDVIYQSTFIDGESAGRADFLIRVETESRLGPWSYEVVETKLARSTKARALIQLCFYSELVAAIQGKLPEQMHVVLGKTAELGSGGADGDAGLHVESFPVKKYLAYFRKIKRDFELAMTTMPVTYPEPVEHCGVCDWYSVCDERWHTDDHLSLVANITRNQRGALVQREVSTLAKLATLGLPMTPKLERVAPAPLLRIREQARVQFRGREERAPVYELMEPAEEGRGDGETRRRGDGEEKLIGLAALPMPSPGDLFLDFEGDPFAFEQGLEYLFGTVRIEEEAKENVEAGVVHTSFDAEAGEAPAVPVTIRRATRVSPVYEEIWAFDPKGEKYAFVEFIQKVKKIRERYPDMHIYHYAAYEQTAIKHLSGRHNICAEEVDELLRAEVFVDLFRVVRQGLRASVESYSIKKLEEFYGFKRTVELRNATASLQAFEFVLALGEDPAGAHEILKTIADYNRDDCLSTWQLREWLEKLRAELETKLGHSIPRPELKSGKPTDELEAELNEIGLLKEQLVAGIPEDQIEWTDEQRARWLLAQLLEWHRRENKSMWWEYYRLCKLSDEELIEDKNALGGLEYIGIVGEEKRSFIHRYRFPVQDHSIDRALEVHDPKTKNNACSEFEIDELNLTIDLKRGKHADKPHPTALIPYDHIPTNNQVASLMRVARWVIENGIEARGAGGGKPTFPTCSTSNLSGDTRSQSDVQRYQAARDLLLRFSPRLNGQSIEELTNKLLLLDTARAMALTLDSSVLPIQGPPGSGKTYTGAHMILALIEAGKRVGVTANSHKVIVNLLKTICEVAKETQRPVRIIQKVTNLPDGHEHECVELTKSNELTLEKLVTGEAQITAGTSWLWAREEFADSVDVLFVDEAGQMSLANVLAMSQAAKSLVLLGDPQQLDQPQKGVHPPAAEVSALSHLLNGRATIEPHQGLFLAESWRLPPKICEFTSEVFYDGRLTTRSENAKQRLNSNGPLDGTGLRFVPVPHVGNQSDSSEEVARISELVNGLLSNGTTWTNKEGATKPLTIEDILIVAPYNAQVALISKSLPAGARVGTVDKFQGQQAPVVFYSMTTSTPEDAPRGMEFLYSANRLNVATSRAQCVTVLVASPALFDVQCKTPRQMELANAFCRYLEMATAI